MRSLSEVKIMHVVHSFGMGGLENGIVNLINLMNKDLFSHSICCMTNSGVFADRIRRDDVKIFELHKKSGNDFTLPIKMKQIFTKENVHIVHARGWGTYLESLIASKLTRSVKGCVFGFHGKTFEDLNVENKRRARIQRILSLFTDKILTLSQSMKLDYSQAVGINEDKISVIWNGVDLSRFAVNVDRTLERLKLGFSANNFIIGCVARIDPVKDIGTLLKAFSLASKKYTNLKLLIVGDGSSLPLLKRDADYMGLNDTVVFTGIRDDVPVLLKIMDLYVQPSLYEGVSNTILEAMASGLPVVATNVGGNPEIVIDNATGLLIPPGNAEILKDTILSFYNDPEKIKKFGSAGLNRAQTEFSMERMIDSYEKFYKTLVSISE